jgi:NAD-dependent deacetylase
MSEELKSMISAARRAVFFGGAGVSTESGIPDFRSETGIFRAEERYGAPPEELLSRSFFLAFPETFYRYYKENLVHKDAKPNPAHKALARLESMGKLGAVITQNIDGLHGEAGSKNILELHGSAFRNYCMGCGRRYALDYILDQANCPGGVVPYCPCGGMVRPDVVLYGEPPDDSVFLKAANEIENCDLLIIGGTSLLVYPAAGLLDWARKAKLVIINKTGTPGDGKADLRIRGPIGEVLSSVMSATHF